MQTKHLTIMFTDMKGFTSRTAVHTREQLERLLDRQEELVKPIFANYGGKVVKTIGDAFMVVFPSPTDAVLCGVKIQEEMIRYNAGALEDEKMEIRIGINSGEVNIKGKDYFGEAVNIASRIESISEANEVYFSESVYLSMNKNEIPSAEIGMRHLKGIPDHIRVYKVLREHQEIDKLRTTRKRMAEDANKYSKSGENVIRLERANRSYSVRTMKMALICAGGLVGLIILIVIVMWAFKICPPKGPWIMPPWCGVKKETLFDNKKPENTKPEETQIRSEIERILKETKKAILLGEEARARKGINGLMGLNEKLRGNAELEKNINNLKKLFEEKFRK